MIPWSPSPELKFVGRAIINLGNEGFAKLLLEIIKDESLKGCSALGMRLTLAGHIAFLFGAELPSKRDPAREWIEALIVRGQGSRRQRVLAGVAVLGLCWLPRLHSGHLQYCLHPLRDAGLGALSEAARDLADGVLEFARPDHRERVRRTLRDGLDGKVVQQRATGKEVTFIHREDFATIGWGKKTCSLGPKQRVVMEMLHDSHQKGEPGMRAQDLLAEIVEPPDNMRDCLRDTKLLGDLVKRAEKGIYRLDPRIRCTTCMKSNK